MPMTEPLAGISGGGSGAFANVSVLTGGFIDLYNLGGPGSANYEKLTADWSANVARIWTKNDGAGSARSLQVGASGTDGATSPASYTTWFAGAVPVINHTIQGGNGTGIFHELATTGSSLNASSGTQTAVAISPTFAGTGTQAGVALLVNPSGTFGSGGGKLQSWQLNSIEVARVLSTGEANFSGTRAGLFLTVASDFAGTNTVVLYSDTSNILAQRNGTNAQAFRIYNTYTDASNYERGAVQWLGNVFVVGTEALGTGSNRDVAIRAGGVNRWQVSGSSGTFIAVSDNTNDIGAAGANRPRDVYAAGRVFVGVVAVASLPSAATSQGSHAFVNNSSVVAAGNFGNVVAAGGANIVPVYSDGTNWRIG